MTFPRMLLTAGLMLALAGPLAAKESGGFVVKLGRDTISVETYRRTDMHIEVDQVGRAPQVLRRSIVWDLAPDGSAKTFSVVVQDPAAEPGAPPLQKIDGMMAGDSLKFDITRGSGKQSLSMALPPGTFTLINSSPWVTYETAIMRLQSGKADSLRTGLYFIGAGSVGWISIHHLGRDSVTVATDHLDVFHMRIDKAGHILGVVPITGTGKFAAERVMDLDVPAVTASFAARERGAGAMGALSTRDTVRVTSAGASLWIDYGRPAKRGRTVYGGIVPYGELWRTGANAATQFKTDQPLNLGGTPLPAGMYTLWTIPAANGWKLVVNSETGQWGTAHKAEKDLFTVDMTVSALPQPVERFTISVDANAQGGVLNMDWDTTRASIPFTVAAGQN
jgi:hypothetical protein